jgi:hypothetical protein
MRNRPTPEFRERILKQRPHCADCASAGIVRQSTSVFLSGNHCLALCAACKERRMNRK